MRGYPIWQVLGVILMFAVAGLPVLRLTLPAASPAVASSPVLPGPTAAKTTLEIQVGFAPAPEDFALRYLGETIVLAGRGPATDFNGSFAVPLPAEGVDLTLQAHWLDAVSGHVAAHVTVRLPDGRETTQTFWSDAGPGMVETLTIKP